MQENKSIEDDFSKPETVYDRHSDLSDISISDIAEMISIYYDEINSVAKNLEKTDSPLPKSDTINLLNSLMEYSKVGNELAATFSERVKKFAIAKSADLDNIETGTL